MAASLEAEGEARRQQHVARELAAAEAQGANTLALNYCKLCVVPECVLASQWARECLQYLYLKYNSIQLLSPAISNLRVLKVLYLRTNKLTEVPHELSNLQCLESLNLSNNSITMLPGSLGLMPALKELVISHNQFISLPNELWNSQSLEFLDASHNQLSTLPASIISCQSLKRLYVHMNRLTFLPLQVTRLPNLQAFHLMGNELRDLPSDFLALRQLTDLPLADNPLLVSVPVSLLLLPHLSGLDLQSCGRLDCLSADTLPVVLTRCSSVAPLLELSARALHRYLKESLAADSLLLWRPSQMCCELQVPSCMEQWLVPRGKCFSEHCQTEYFQHCWRCAVSGLYAREHLLPELEGSGRMVVQQNARKRFTVTLCSSRCAADTGLI